MEERFRVCPHNQLPGKMMVEYWRGKEYVAGIYPHEDGIRIVSKHLDGVEHEAGNPPAVVIRFSK
ncbi:unnamed protein product [marine sediment metagenome]|uniref:Uncharacterized protein n=1 Tax=marine sediment metagenome TaxID=412755 RepID=X1NXE2_9ZZZZ